MKNYLRNLIIIFILVLIGILALPKPEKAKPINIESSARGACKIFIKREVDDPSALEFLQSPYPEVFKKPNGEYVVLMWVRGKNSFNATIRVQMRCVLLEDGDSWRIVSVS